MHILSFILKTGSYNTAISLVGIKLTCLPHSLVLGSKPCAITSGSNTHFHSVWFHNSNKMGKDRIWPVAFVC